MRGPVLLIGLLLGGGLAVSCTLTEDDPPDRTCSSDDECFRAQGERCNTDLDLCEVMPDAGVAVQAVDPEAP